jgi:hypothetical protein
MARDGLPAVRIRTLAQDGNVTGEVLLGPTAAEKVAANCRSRARERRNVDRRHRGVSHGDTMLLGMEDGMIEIAWDEGGRFDYPTP